MALFFCNLFALCEVIERFYCGEDFECHEVTHGDKVIQHPVWTFFGEFL